MPLSTPPPPLLAYSPVTPTRRHVKASSSGVDLSVYQREHVPRGVLFDLAVDQQGGRAVTVGQDGQLRVFDVATGRPICSIALDASKNGEEHAGCFRVRAGRGG